MSRSVRSLLLLSAFPALAAAQSTYPAGAGVGKTDPVKFTVRIENVSTPATLKLSNGKTAPAPNAPSLWVVHTEQEPIFTPGTKDRGQGLESLAEDGDPGRLADALKGKKGIVGVGFVNKPVGSVLPGPALPGNAYEFSFTAAPGQKLSIASMFGQSNDVFFATGPRGIELFDSRGVAKDGDMTADLQLWDAGTEVNEEPGLGPNQAPRQSGANTGPSESKPVDLVRDRFKYPKVSEVIKVTITAAK